MKSAVTFYTLFNTGSFRVQRNPGRYCSFLCADEVDNQLPTLIQLSNNSLASITKIRTQFTQWENTKIVRMNCKKTPESVQIKFDVMCSMDRITKQQINAWFIIFWVGYQSKHNKTTPSKLPQIGVILKYFNFSLIFLVCYNKNIYLKLWKNFLFVGDSRGQLRRFNISRFKTRSSLLFWVLILGDLDSLSFVIGQLSVKMFVWINKYLFISLSDQSLV